MEFWPFDIDSGPAFLGFYVLFAITALVGAVRAGGILAARSERRALAE